MTNVTENGFQDACTAHVAADFLHSHQISEAPCRGAPGLGRGKSGSLVLLGEKVEMPCEE